MDEQKNYIMVDNETYELYDGNGSIYVTKANKPDVGHNQHQNEFYSQKAIENSFFDNLMVPTTVTDNSKLNFSSGQHHMEMEPIIINDYGNMNYFTQAASDVTIYLNSNNETNFMQTSGSSKANYFVDSDGVIDLTKVSANGIPNSIEMSETESTLDLNHTIQNISNEELDAPEFIDISNLKISDIIATPKNSLELHPSKNFAQINCTALTVDLVKDQSDEDEVIFVKEFKTDTKNDVNNKPLDLRSRSTADRPVPQPRRNPKRQVQILKESFDLALKLSDEEIYCGQPKKYYKEYYTENTRRSNRNTGAVLRPPTRLTNEDYKEWPTEGLHERPIFNTVTKKIEKFDFKNTVDKHESFISKNNMDTAKNTTLKKPVGKKGKRKAPYRTNKSVKKPPEGGISKEFAQLTHETLQEVIKYVSQVKEYNEIIKGKSNSIEPPKGTGDVIEDANSIIALVRSNEMEKNLSDAVQMLTDSCVLYSLANDVCQDSVAKFLKSIKNN